MNIKDALEVLKAWDNQGRYVFTKHDLSKLFPRDNPKTLSEGLNRLINANILERACSGIYVNKRASSFDSYTLERITVALRRGVYNYVSLESVLSEHGLISQIPIDRLTVITTGRKGEYKTPYGVIEFTHTKRTIKNILENTISIEKNPLRVATKETALRDLKRVGRNLNLLEI